MSSWECPVAHLVCVPSGVGVWGEQRLDRPLSLIGEVTEGDM